MQCHHLDFMRTMTSSVSWKSGNEPSGSGGIGTHVTEMTGAQNQRLRPVGHATQYINARIAFQS